MYFISFLRYLIVISALVFLPFQTSLGKPLQVVASFSIISDLAKQVGKEHVEIKTLVDREGDVHHYEPKPTDVVKLNKADLILMNGLQFEGFLPRLLAASETSAPVVTLSDGIAALNDSNQQPDPHAWHSIPNAMVYIDNIANAFCEVNPDNCQTYQENAKSYGEELSTLDQEIQQAIETLPQHNRTVVTRHQAFQYFEDRYGLHFFALEGSAAQAETSARRLANAIKQLQQGTAHAIFAESFHDNRLITQVSKESGVAVSGTLYSDTLSSKNGEAESYLALMKHNVGLLMQALQHP